MGIIAYSVEENMFAHLSVHTTCKELQKSSEAMDRATQQSPTKKDTSTVLVPMKHPMSMYT